MGMAEEGGEYKPPKVWTYKSQGGKFGSINKPTAGPQTDEAVKKGKCELQLHSLATPNGVKVTALLEELNLKYGLEYDAYHVNIMSGEQFKSGFVDINPNSKIPALLHYKDGLDRPPIRIFETAAIMIYLCEQFDVDRVFLPDPKSDPGKYAECINFLMWMQGSGPIIGGGFGHFYHYAPVKIEYAINRFSMDVKRLMDVLERHLSGVELNNVSQKISNNYSGGPYLCGDAITVADFACFPWYGWLAQGKLYGDSLTFLDVEKSYPHVVEWANRISERDGVKRGTVVNKSWGEESEQMPERHSSKDFS